VYAFFFFNQKNSEKNEYAPLNFGMKKKRNHSCHQREILSLFVRTILLKFYANLFIEFEILKKK